MKLSDAEREELLRIHDALAPMHETLSQTIRWALRTMHMLIFTEGSLARVAAMLQGLQRSKLSYTDSVPCAQKQPPIKVAVARAAPSPKLVSRPLRFSITRATATWGTSLSLPNLRPDWREVQA